MNARSHSTVFANRMYFAVVHEYDMSYVGRWCKVRKGKNYCMWHISFTCNLSISVPKNECLFRQMRPFSSSFCVTNCVRRIFGSTFQIEASHVNTKVTAIFINVSRARKTQRQPTHWDRVSRARANNGERRSRESRESLKKKYFSKEMGKHEDLPDGNMCACVGQWVWSTIFWCRNKVNLLNGDVRVMRHIAEMCGCRMKGNWNVKTKWKKKHNNNNKNVWNVSVELASSLEDAQTSQINTIKATQWKEKNDDHDDTSDCCTDRQKRREQNCHSKWLCLFEDKSLRVWAASVRQLFGRALKHSASRRMENEKTHWSGGTCAIVHSPFMPFYWRGVESIKRHKWYVSFISPNMRRKKKIKKRHETTKWMEKDWRRIWSKTIYGRVLSPSCYQTWIKFGFLFICTFFSLSFPCRTCFFLSNLPCTASVSQAAHEEWKILPYSTHTHTPIGLGSYGEHTDNRKKDERAQGLQAATHRARIVRSVSRCAIEYVTTSTQRHRRNPYFWFLFVLFDEPLSTRAASTHSI